MGKPFTFAGLIANGYMVGFSIAEGNNQLVTLFNPVSGDIQEVITTIQEVQPYLD